MAAELSGSGRVGKPALPAGPVGPEGGSLSGPGATGVPHIENAGIPGSDLVRTRGPLNLASGSDEARAQGEPAHQRKPFGGDVVLLQGTGRELQVPRPEIDLGLAKEVLGELVATDEQSDDDIRNFLKRHSGTTIRGSLLAVTLDLLTSRPNESAMHFVIKKEEKEGNKKLALCLHADSRREVSMQMYSPTDSVLQTYFYLPQESSDGTYPSRFEHYRNGVPLHVADTDRDVTLPGHLGYTSRYDRRYFETPTLPTEEEYKTILYGMRWNALNLLHWEEPQIGLPDDLPRVKPPVRRGLPKGS